jgi:hypothetical protein
MKFDVVPSVFLSSYFPLDGGSEAKCQSLESKLTDALVIVKMM